MPGSDEDLTRLIAVIERQRRELDHVRASAVGESVIAMARGALMERLGLSSAEAASQLAELSAATGVPLGEMAAAVLSVDDVSVSGPPADPTRPDTADGPGRGGAGPGGAGQGRAGPGHAGRGSLLAEAAAELAADGAELASALAGQVLAPLDAAAVVIWVLEADGSLSLLGEAGLSGAEASHWQRVPPQLDFPAQRVARGAPDLWWNAGRPQATAHRSSGPPARRAPCWRCGSEPVSCSA